MDERIIRKQAHVAAQERLPFVRDDGASLSANRGGAEIITLHPDKHRSRAPTPYDPPNVPIDEHIGRHLKAIYDDVLNQPIPGRFLDLLNQLGSEPSTDEDAPCEDLQ